MRNKYFFRHMQSLVLGLFIIFSVSSNVEAFDFTDWDALVKKYVAPKTLDGVPLNAIDYVGLKKDPVFAGLVSKLAAYDPKNLKSRDSKLVFWINTYNVFAAKMITDNYPVKSIKDVGSIFKAVWKRPAGKVDGKSQTLNDIEHEILRKMDEPRIHVAIVCASVSCPDLRIEAFTVENLDEQLDDQMKKFLSSKEKGMKLDAGKNKVYLSSIFKWFKEDFKSRGGVLKFIGKYVSPADSKALSNSKIKVSYLDYNWKVNG